MAGGDDVAARQILNKRFVQFHVLAHLGRDNHASTALPGNVLRGRALVHLNATKVGLCCVRPVLIRLGDFFHLL